jgi:superfamily II DNA or RNA helicase
MLDSTAGPEVWPSGVAIVAGREFVGQPDVLDSLATSHWDLIICDEAHWFQGARAENLRRLQGAADRIVLATVPGLEMSDVFPTEHISVVDWRRETLVDLAGNPLDRVPRPLLLEVPFSLNQDETDLRETVNALGHVLEAGTSQQAWVAKALVRACHSSPAALEATLRKVAAEPHAESDAIWAGTVEEKEEEVPDESRISPADPVIAEKTRAIAAGALQVLDAVRDDSKLAAFAVLLRRLKEAVPPRLTCVVTDYMATLYYLAAEIENLGVTCRLFHGGMGPEERHQAVAQHISEGGVLAGTQAIMTAGIGLPHVTDLVLYDIPSTQARLRQALGRFDRFGRASQLTVHALVPTSESDADVSGALAVLREVLGATKRE